MCGMGTASDAGYHHQRLHQTATEAFHTYALLTEGMNDAGPLG